MENIDVTNIDIKILFLCHLSCHMRRYLALILKKKKKTKQDKTNQNLSQIEFLEANQMY